MLQLVGGEETVRTHEDSHNEAVQRAIDVGASPEAQRAICRLHRAAQRALRRDTGGVRNFKAFAVAAALRPWMAAEAAELDLELRAIAADEGRQMGDVSREVVAVYRALASFLDVHGRTLAMSEGA